MRELWLIGAAWLLIAGQAAAMTPDYIRSTIPDAQPVGQGTGRFLAMKLYDAVLYAPQGRYTATGPLALSLTYARNFNGPDIVRRSVDEMRRQGVPAAQLADWKGRMGAIFPDVGPGTTITGLRALDGATRFFADGKLLGAIDDPAFGRQFFDIWLSHDTADPTLRAELLK